MAEPLFWVVSCGLAGLTAALIALAMLGRDAVRPAQASDVRVYRDQLAEVERDLARGTLDAEEAERVRVEVSRRLIEADRADRAAARPGRTPRGATLVAALLVAAAMVVGAAALYARLGAPGYPDLPLATRIAMADAARAARPGQAAAEAEMDAVLAARPPAPTASDSSFLDLMARLRAAMAERPDDLAGFRLLARNEAGLGNFGPAARAQEQVLRILGTEANAGDHADLAEYLILAAGGYVSPEAETQLTRALRIDASDGRSRYYSGLLYAQTGRPDLAFRLWRGLLEAGPQDAPWIEPIRAQIAPLSRLAGVRYDPPAARGPSSDDIAAAEEMSAEDRAEMIGGMVASLADRLARDGGPPEDWARLIVSLGVIGEAERAGAIWEEAQQTFADDPDAMQTLRAAATQAGVGR